MNRVLLDAKKLLLGQDGSENIPSDFKEEINNSLKNNLINKAMATLLMTARKNVDNLGNKIVKKQESDVSGKGTRVSTKQAEKLIDKSNNEINIETKKEKKKEEEERKKREKQQESLRQTMQRIAEEDEKSDNIKYNQKRKIM